MTILNDYGNLSQEWQDTCLLAAQAWIGIMDHNIGLADLSVADIRTLLNEAQSYIPMEVSLYVLRLQVNKKKQSRGKEND